MSQLNSPAGANHWVSPIQRLGHADITLTLNTYSHVLPAMQEEAAEKLDMLLTPIEISREINQMAEEPRISSLHEEPG